MVAYISSASAPTDPLFLSQWHLHGTYGINAVKVWENYTGRGIRVAVLDQGIEAGHPDLGHLDLSRSIIAFDGGPGGVPLTSKDKHGTAVAGIIGATANNGVGGVGVAYDSTLISIYMGNMGTQGEANAFNHSGAYADVMNNSWSYPMFMADDFLKAAFTVVAEAIKNAVATGRQGLGCIIVESAGNYRQPYSYQPDPDSDYRMPWGDNVNYHNHQNSRFITAVAATGEDGSAMPYSNPGAAILVAAPGSPGGPDGTIVTTDRQGIAGYSTGDYTNSFNGTSAAAPMVSGIAALMLEANPFLGYRDVQEILAMSARSTPLTQSSFQFNGSSHWNGGGMHFSHYVGAGLVDALAAVRLAETWQGSGTAANEASIFSNTAVPGLLIPDNNSDGVSSTIRIDSGINIDHVEVSMLRIVGSRIGDIVVTLTSPNGTTSTLMNQGGGGLDYFVFNLSSTQFWGETGIGDWTLRVKDMTVGGTTGTLVSWQLRLYGDALTADDVYVYTNEYGSITENLPVRQTLNDANGGTDTVNAAAVSTNSLIILDGSAYSNIAGRSLNIVAETIECVFGGDGGDRIVGNGLNNRLNGGRGNDQIYGGDGADLLNGGAGTDTMSGGAGDDTYSVDSAGDGVVEAFGAGVDLVWSSASFRLGSDVENLILTGTAALTGDGNALDNVLTGNSGNNVLAGNGGNDTLNGGQGGDRLIGGSGDDVYVVDNSGDVVVEYEASGADMVRTTLTYYTLGMNLENLIFWGDVNANVVGKGNLLNNMIYGLNGSDTLDGGAGNDTLFGRTGDDVYLVDSAGDVVVEYESSGADMVRTTLTAYALGSNVEKLVYMGRDRFAGVGNLQSNWITGGNAADTLYGVDGDDTLQGGAGNDVLDGGAGSDLLIGGTGNDLYIVDSTDDLVQEGATAGTDTVSTTLAFYTLRSNLENLLSLGTENFRGTGNALDNVLTGNGGNNLLNGAVGNDTLKGGAGNDTLNGGLGNDALMGGVGDDTYVVNNTGDVVSEGAAEGTDWVQTTLLSYTLGSNVENLNFTGVGNFTGRGNGLNNRIVGGIGSDGLNGGAGSDTMIGGGGNDTYVVDNAGDEVSEWSSSGIDTVWTTLTSYVLNSNVENLVFTGSGQFKGTGNSLNNAVTGGAGDDQLKGGAGSDRLNGRAGSDVLNGGEGLDSMLGGAGNDSYYADSAGDVVIEVVGGGWDVVFSSVSRTIDANVEALALTGSDNLNATGRAGRDYLVGNAGSNRLDGKAGADRIQGGDGDDIYIVDNDGDVVIEAMGGGWDVVFSSVNRTIDANVEKLVLTGNEDINGTGQSGSDYMVGNAGRNYLNGGAGSDTMIGGAGNDTYVVDNAGDGIVEWGSSGEDMVQTSLLSYTLSANIESLVFIGSGNFKGNGNALNNSITGGMGRDLLNGGSGNDHLNGNSGNDMLNGGVGSDTMIGGAGNDTYVVDNASESVIEWLSSDIDSIWTSLSTYTLDSNFENLVCIGSANFTGTGNTLRNVITGAAGNDLLNSGAGNDTLNGKEGADLLNGGSGNDNMIGGAGNDTYVMDSAGDIAYEAGGAGIDMIRTVLLNQSLNDNLEILLFIGTGDFTGNGNALNNQIIGASGRDLLNGDSGNDLLNGREGNDTLYGGSGHDWLNGGADNDIMQGGTGNDTFIVNTAGDRVVEWGNSGIDSVETKLLSYTLAPNLELLNFTGNGNFKGIGNSLNNSILSGAGNDVLSGGDGRDLLRSEAGHDMLNGGVGSDTMVGGAGNDTYVVDNAGDEVSEWSASGYDSIQTTLVSYVLNANVESLIFTGNGNFSGKGNGLDNKIIGASGKDSLNGGAGDDSLNGGAGNDLLYGVEGNDTLFGGMGNDSLSGGLSGADQFIFSGSWGHDRIIDDGVACSDDSIWIEGVGHAQVSVKLSGADLFIAYGSNDIRVENWNNMGIDQLNQFHFSDGWFSVQHQGASLVWKA